MTNEEVVVPIENLTTAELLQLAAEQEAFGDHEHAAELRIVAEFSPEERRQLAAALTKK